jgi:hypothetical protein
VIEGDEQRQNVLLFAKALVSKGENSRPADAAGRSEEGIDCTNEVRFREAFCPKRSRQAVCFGAFSSENAATFQRHERRTSWLSSRQSADLKPVTGIVTGGFCAGFSGNASLQGTSIYVIAL